MASQSIEQAMNSPAGLGHGAVEPRPVPWTAALVVFLVFLGYYAVTAKILPSGAGPDFGAHRDVVEFMVTHHRLPVFPADEAKLHFTPYGTTRALRPPLSYIVSAVTAVVLEPLGLDHLHAMRMGSALLCALSVMLSFVMVYILLTSLRLALLSAMAFGLIPQVVFIASYVNDDSGAMFAAALALTSLTALHRYGATPWTAAAFGAGLGFSLLAKFTSWIELPVIAVFALLVTPRPWKNPFRLFALAVVVSILCGGWWLGFNVSQYGLDDPLQQNITHEMMERHARIQHPDERGFQAEGISIGGLLVRNYHNFVGESFKSTIGNLDWLRLRLGWPQYLTYLAFIVVALAWGCIRMCAGVMSLFSSRLRRWLPPRDTAFIVCMLAIIVLQTAMYVWFNYKHDIQVQGRYLLPIMPAVMLLLADGFFVFGRWRDARGNGKKGNRGLTLDVPLFAALVLLLGIHIHAWTNYVVPWYKPPTYQMALHPFQPFPLNDRMAARAPDTAILRQRGGWTVVALGGDPRIIFSRAACSRFAPNNLVKVYLDAESPGEFRIYKDEGEGFSEKHSLREKYPAGESTLLFALELENCKHIRIDPLDGLGQVHISKITVARLGIDRFNEPR